MNNPETKQPQDAGTDKTEMRLCFEEFRVKTDSKLQGWQAALQLIHLLIDGHAFLGAWVFKKKYWSSYYEVRRVFTFDDSDELKNHIEANIFRDVIYIIRLLEERVPFDVLIENYGIEAEGVIDNSEQAAVFPAPIESGDWTMIRKGEFLLVVHHDGDPLFTLKSCG